MSVGSAGGPDPPKARSSPNSFSTNNGGSGGNTRDVFSNCATDFSLVCLGANSTARLPTDSAALLFYYIPHYQHDHWRKAGLSSQLNENPGVIPFVSQTQTPVSANTNSPYPSFGYTMLGVGLPGMNVLGVLGGCPYNNQMGNFQVRTRFYRRLPIVILMVRLTDKSRRSILWLPSRLLSVPPTLLPVVPSTLETASVDELLNLAHLGPLESNRVLPEKS